MGFQIDSTPIVGGGLLVAGAAGAGGVGYKKHLKPGLREFEVVEEPAARLQYHLKTSRVKASNVVGFFRKTSALSGDLAATADAAWPGVRKHLIHGGSALVLGSTAAGLGASHILDTNALAGRIPPADAAVGVVMAAGGVYGIKRGVTQFRGLRAHVDESREAVKRVQAAYREGPGGVFHWIDFVGEIRKESADAADVILSSVRQSKRPAFMAGLAVVGGGTVATLGAGHILDVVAGPHLEDWHRYAISGGLVAAGVGFGIRGARAGKEVLRIAADAETGTRPLLLHLQHTPPLLDARAYAQALGVHGSNAAEAMLHADDIIRSPLKRMAWGLGPGIALAALGVSQLIDHQDYGKIAGKATGELPGKVTKKVKDLLPD